MLIGKEIRMKTLAFLSGVIASPVLQAQEAAPLLRHWNSPAKIVTLAEIHSEAKPRVILLQEASQFSLPPSVTLSEGYQRKDGGLGFELNMGDRVNCVLFDPTENQKGGKFTVLKTICGGPRYELVPGSEAEKNLLKFLKDAYKARLSQPMDPSTDDKCGCENRARKTLEALALLLGYFPNEGAER
jgi:hypothetical protein